MSITIKDIAKLANVSHTTVSRALNDSPLIKEETKKKIKELSERFGYAPNLSARSLVLEKSYSIGFFGAKLIEKMPTSFLYEIMEGINSEIGDEYSIITSKFSEIGDIDKKVAKRALDGIVFISMDASDLKLIYKLTTFDIPMVVLNRDTRSDQICCVYIDDYKGAFNAVEYLIMQGHTRIAAIKGAQEFITTKERYRGYIDAINKYKLPLKEEYVADSGFDPESGYLAMRGLLKAKTLPTAVFVSGDLEAVGAMKACNEAGLNIPNDISIMGFDDMDFSQYLIPSLTTIRKSRKAMGQQGSQLLMDIINEKKPDFIAKEVESELIIRESCKSIK